MTGKQYSDYRLFKREPQDDSKYCGSRTAQIWAALDRCESLLERSAAERIDPQRVIELESALRDAQAELGQMRDSTLWRIGSKAHRFSNRVPAVVRRQLRRVAKSVYWLLTPHKIAARIRYRQASRQTSSAEADSPTRSASPPIFGQGGYFRFVPGAKSPLAHDAGQYSLAQEPHGYTYIPPRRPERLGQALHTLKRLPQFSLVVPVFNTPLDVFQSMIASVQAQWYPFWELILVDDCSTALNVPESTRSLVGVDERVHVMTLTGNHGISEATNIGLAAARGEYIVFLDHDDELTPDCLFELAKAINRDNPDYLYSDEDKITSSGVFTEPSFKPDWSPETLMSMMYSCHVSCVRRDLLVEVGFLRKEFDGSQDWDLILRVTERAEKITHIPKVLYHWRIIPGSAAATVDAKPYAIEAGKRAREDALKRRGLTGTLKAVDERSFWFRTVYAVQGSPKVSIIIPSKNNKSVLEACITSILANTRYRQFEVIIMDNGSDDVATVVYLSELGQNSQIAVIRDASAFNWSALSNKGAKNATGKIFLFLNDDTEVRTPEWLEEMVGYAQLGHVAAVGAKLVYPDTNKVQHQGVVVLDSGPAHALQYLRGEAPGPFARNRVEFNYIGVTGACLMITKEKFERLRGFNEEFAVAYNDVDLCFRAVKAGWYNVVCQGAELIHHESISRGSDFLDDAKFQRLTMDRKRLYRLHPEFFLSDPFHNTNLHPNDTCYQITQ
jgi:GT2 family glycosyltransferase